MQFQKKKKKGYGEKIPIFSCSTASSIPNLEFKKGWVGIIFYSPKLYVGFSCLVSFRLNINIYRYIFIYFMVGGASMTNLHGSVYDQSSRICISMNCWMFLFNTIVDSSTKKKNTNVGTNHCTEFYHNMFEWMYKFNKTFMELGPPYCYASRWA